MSKNTSNNSLSTSIKPHILTEIYRRGWKGACENLTESEQNEISKALLEKLPNEFLADLFGILSQKEETTIILNNYQKVNQTSVLSLVLNAEGDKSHAISVSEKLSTPFSQTQQSPTENNNNQQQKITKKYIMAEDYES